MFWLFVAVALKSLDKNKGKLDDLHKEGKLHTPTRLRILYNARYKHIVTRKEESLKSTLS